MPLYFYSKKTKFKLNKIRKETPISSVDIQLKPFKFREMLASLYAMWPSSVSRKKFIFLMCQAGHDYYWSLISHTKIFPPVCLQQSWNSRDFPPRCKPTGHFRFPCFWQLILFQLLQIERTSLSNARNKAENLVSSNSAAGLCWRQTRSKNMESAWLIQSYSTLCPSCWTRPAWTACNRSKIIVFQEINNAFPCLGVWY